MSKQCTERVDDELWPDTQDQAETASLYDEDWLWQQLTGTVDSDLPSATDAADQDAEALYELLSNRFQDQALAPEKARDQELYRENHPDE